MEFKREHLIFILLLGMMVYGFQLRSFHLDFPSIGYHNMKENEYLSQAKFNYDDGDYLRRRMHIFGIEENLYFEEYPQMPILPWIFVVMWSIFGLKFWAARIVIVLFSVATIPMLYQVAKKLTNSEYIALTSALLFSFMPLAVFFGRNIQPETPALFFLLAGMFFYLNYIESWKRSDAIKTSAMLALSALFKPTFLIGLIPMLAIFPFEHLKDSKLRSTLVKHVGWMILTFSPMPLWNLISNFLNTKETLTQGTFTRINLFRIFTGNYWNEFWPTLSAYIADNYTWWYVYATVLGLALLILRYRSKLSRFMLAYALAAIPYAMILADYLKGHSYYQFPFLPLVCIASAYVLYTLGALIKAITKIPHIEYLALLLLFLPAKAVALHTNVQFDTIFYGLDVVGGYLKTHSDPTERLFMSGHSQSFGVCFNADRLCGPPIWDNLNKTVALEKERNFRWLFVHGAAGLYEMQIRPEIWEYFQENYRIRLVGLGPRQMNGQPVPEVYLFERGGNFTMETLNQVPYSQAINTYTTTGGEVQMIVLEDNR